MIKYQPRELGTESPRTIFVLADGLSFSMLNLLSQMNLFGVTGTGLSNYYPAILSMVAIEQRFSQTSVINAAPNCLRRVTSFYPPAAISTGLPETLLEKDNSELIVNNHLFRRLRKKGVKTGFVTNSTVSDSTMAALLFPEMIPRYRAKTRAVFDQNECLEKAIVERFHHGDWDLVYGGGRSLFFPESSPDIATGESGKATRNHLDTFRSEGIEILTELDSRERRSASLDKRRLCLIHNNYPRYQAERAQTQAIEPSLSQMLGESMEALSSEESGWFLFLESGRIDHAAHINNGYFLLGELLELAATIDLALETAKMDPRITVVLTSDHPTGGFSLADNSARPYEPFASGASWATGPGPDRPDSCCFWKNGMEYFDESFSKNISSQLAFQPVAVPANVAAHERGFVPFFAHGSCASLFSGVKSHMEIYGALCRVYGLENPAKPEQGSVTVITGPAAVGKSTVARHLQTVSGAFLLSGDEYLNLIEDGSDKLTRASFDAVINDIVNDARSLVRMGKDVIIDFVFVELEDLIIIERLRKESISLQLFVLEGTESLCLERDSQRFPEEQMGERCSELVSMYRYFRPQLELCGAVFVNASTSLKEIVKRILLSAPGL